MEVGINSIGEVSIKIMAQSPLGAELLFSWKPRPRSMHNKPITPWNLL
jgi:hypothetical protein